MEKDCSRYPVTASCSGYELRKDTSKYFAYEIRVHWSDGTNAVVYRRYSQFFNLQCKLLDNFPDEAGTKDPATRTIPFLPGKKLVGNLNEKTAEKRKTKLGDYITALMKMPVKISQCKFVVNFFESRQSDLTSLIDRKRGGSTHMFTGSTISEPLVLPKYQVVEPYKATQHGELTLELGSVIVVVEKKETGWWFAQSTDDDSQGWVPASYLDPLYQSGDEDEFCSLPMNPERFVCTESYTAVRNDEISAQIGECVEVLKKNSDGWWLVMRQDKGKQGYFPAVYLKKANTLKAKELNAKLETKSFVRKIGEVSKTPTRKLSKYAPPRKSIKPARPARPPSIAQVQPAPKSYTVIADFTNTTEGGLTLYAGNVVKLILKDDSGWWLIEVDGGEQGWAPSTYLKLVESGPPKPQRSPQPKPAPPPKTTNSPVSSPKMQHRTPSRRPAVKKSDSKPQIGASTATKPIVPPKSNSQISENLSEQDGTTLSQSNRGNPAVKLKPVIRAKPTNINNNNLLNNVKKPSPETRRRPERPAQPNITLQEANGFNDKKANVKNIIAQLSKS